MRVLTEDDEATLAAVEVEEEKSAPSRARMMDSSASRWRTPCDVKKWTSARIRSMRYCVADDIVDSQYESVSDVRQSRAGSCVVMQSWPFATLASEQHRTNLVDAQHHVIGMATERGKAHRNGSTTTRDCNDTTPASTPAHYCSLSLTR